MTRFLLLASLLAISVPALSVPAFAQDIPVGPDHDHDQIIVTGVFADRNVDEVVANISVLDREEIVSDLRTTLGDTLDREPGVSTTFFGAGASRPVLRGLGAERVLVLTNGIGAIDVSAASPDHQVGADGIDAERIEILRGPAALAFGGQAIGGVVNVIDGQIAERVPEDGFALDAFGAWNTAFDGPEAAANGAYAFETGNGALVVAGSVSHRDFEDYDIPGGIESDVLLAEEGEEPEDAEDGILPNSFVETTTYSGGASFVFGQPGSGGFLGAAIRDTSSEYGLPGGHEHEEGEGEPADAEEEEEENPFIVLDQTRYDIRGGLDFETGFIAGLRVNAAIADYGHIEFEAPGEPGTIYERDGWEGRAEARTRAGDIRGSVGVQILDNELFADGEEAFITPTDTQSRAVFAFQRWRNEDAPVSVEGGVRFETTEYENVQFGDAEFDLISASAGAHFHPSEPIFLGAEVAYTERAPNESELFSDGVHLATRQFEQGNPELAEERGTNFELTARYDTGAWRIGANGFLTSFDNFTTLLPGTALFEGEVTGEVEGFPVFLFTQGDADFIGGEIYAEADLDTDFAELGLRASVDYVDGEFEAVGGDIDVPLLPPVTFNASVDADFGVFGAMAALTVAGDQDEPGPGGLPTDGYTNLDLGVNVGLDQWLDGVETLELFAQARNVTDEEIRYSTSTLRDFAPAPGRNFRVGVRTSF